MTPTEMPVTVCDYGTGGACDFASVEDAQVLGHRHLVLYGELGRQVVLLDDTLVEAGAALLYSDFGIPAFQIVPGADRVRVLDLTVYRRSNGTIDPPLVYVDTARDVTFERLTATGVVTPSAKGTGTVLHVDHGASVTLQDPLLVGNRGSGQAPVSVIESTLTVLDGRISDNRNQYGTSAIYAGGAALRVERTELGGIGFTSVHGDGSDITLIDVDGTWQNVAVEAYLGTLTVRGGVWTAADPISGAPLLVAGTTRRVTVEGTRFVRPGPRPITLFQTDRVDIVGAVFEDTPDGVIVGEANALSLRDSWICGTTGDLPALLLSFACADGCDVSGTVFADTGPGGVATVDGDLTVARTTVASADPRAPVFRAAGRLTLDRVLVEGGDRPAVDAGTLAVSDSAFGHVAGLPDGARALDPVWRGVPTGPCGLDVQLAGVPEQQWLADRGVGALPMCWTDEDGDGLGADGALVDLQASAETCPAGSVPIPGDCDDTDPSHRTDCGAPPPPPDPGLLRLASGTCAAAGPALPLGGPAAALGAALALLRRGRGRPAASPRGPLRIERPR